jgi:hypothetical protein
MHVEISMPSTMQTPPSKNFCSTVLDLRSTMCKLTLLETAIMAVARGVWQMRSVRRMILLLAQKTRANAIYCSTNNNSSSNVIVALPPSTRDPIKTLHRRGYQWKLLSNRHALPESLTGPTTNLCLATPLPKTIILKNH